MTTDRFPELEYPEGFYIVTHGEYCGLVKLHTWPGYGRGISFGQWDGGNFVALENLEPEVTLEPVRIVNHHGVLCTKILCP